MAIEGRKRYSVVVRLLFGLSTFAILFLMVHPRDVLEALRHADLHFIFLGALLCFLGIAARAYRWMLILRHLAIRVPFWRVLEISMISLWFNTFLPGSVGGDLYKIYDVSKASAKKIRPAAAVLLERLTGVLTLLGVAIVALTVFRGDIPMPHWVFPLILGGTGLITLTLLAVMLFFDTLWSLLAVRLPWLSRVLDEKKARSIADVSNELRRNPRLFIEACLLGLVVQGLTLGAYALMARSILPDIPILYFFTFFPLIEIASLVPITVNGIGLKEGLIVLSLGMSHVEGALSMSLGILFRIVGIFFALIGGALLLNRKPAGWQTENAVVAARV